MPVAQQADTSLKDVEIGGKVQHIADDARSPRSHGQRSHDQLEKVHGCGITDSHLVRSRAQHPSDLVSDPARGLIPTGIPAPDQIPPPLLLYRHLHALHRMTGQATERVAVQVNQARLRQGKCLTKVRQVILCVQLPGELQAQLKSRVVRFYHLDPPMYRHCHQLLALKWQQIR